MAANRYRALTAPIHTCSCLVATAAPQGFVALTRRKHTGKGQSPRRGPSGGLAVRRATPKPLWVGLVAVCPACHGVKHLGRSYVEGRGDEAIAQRMAVHGSSAERAKAYAGLVLEIWKLRNGVP
jgi:hypothetical protein